ncbi:unnamed protein product [Echinostoma caproni]|uniref:OAR domain-containing protein n=1 Tax=Echinostoma caproni TaxID=27848 RepID=A0A183AFX2_9TREM|nr:unnamed protein product [Echinostoma caproni]
MPEYASASLFSGNGSVRQCSTLNSDTTEAIKSKGTTGETYCVPHQNGSHQHFSLWTSTGPGLVTSNPAGLNSMANGHVPMLAKSGLGLNHPSETFTGSSLDSSGLYYLANASDSVGPRNTSGLVPVAESQPLFLSTYGTQPASLIPLTGMATLLSPSCQRTTNLHTTDSVFPYPTQLRHNLFELARTNEVLPNQGGNPIEPSGSDQSPVLLPVATSKGKSGSDPS